MGPGTRSKATAELSMNHQVATAISPTANQITSKISENADIEATPEHAVYRQPSLIPAYRYEDGIHDLDIDLLMGTPFSCEVAYAKKVQEKNKEKKKRQKANKAIKKEAPKLEEEDEFFTPISTAAASPPSPTAAAAAAVPSAEEDLDNNDIIASMEAMSLGKHDPTSSSKKEDASASLLLKGIPAWSRSHVHFFDENSDEDGEEDDSNASHRSKMYLRGIPRPTGTHTTFEEE